MNANAETPAGALKRACYQLSPQGEKPYSCMGPRCMAWRWFDGLREHGFCGAAGQGVTAEEMVAVARGVVS